MQIDVNMPLEKCCHTKQWGELYCSGCSRRGHLIHTCRITVPFANHPINSPYVCVYRPLYCPRNQDPNKQLLNKSFSQDSTISSATTPNKGDGSKRLSKSPTSHENHSNKKRNMSAGDEPKTNQFTKSPATNVTRPNPTIKEVVDDGDKNKESSKISLDTSKERASEKAPDFIPIDSWNHDNEGHVIQDNEVSDTSEVVTSARIYITDYVFDKLQMKENQDWLKETIKKLNVTIQCCGGAYPFLSIQGKGGDQESFQYLLRERQWDDEVSEANVSKPKNYANNCPKPAEKSVSNHINLPKNRYSLLRQITKALDSLKQDFGDPKVIHKELTYLQNRHEKLLKQKVINPTVLTHSRTNINNMLKKLNTVLLGQAGLANGSSSVRELNSYLEKLSSHRGNTISMRMRNEIGEHFHSIFSPNARDDYSELLKRYDLLKPKINLERSKKDNQFMTNSKLKKINRIPSKQDDTENTESGPHNDAQKSIQVKKLMFYYQRLRKAKPKGTDDKKAKDNLIGKVRSSIASMFQNEELSPKTMKKIKRAQEEAQYFLSANV